MASLIPNSIACRCPTSTKQLQIVQDSLLTWMPTQSTPNRSITYQTGTDVAAAGILPVASASIGEAAHLNHSERINVIKTLRNALNSIDLHETPIVAGVGAPSTRETIQLARDAAASGAEFVLVVPPGYYARVLKGNPAAMHKFFIDVAAASPVPVIIYNYPAVASGIDLDSDDVVAIARAAPNICGIMLSCGNVGKLARITTVVNNSSFTTLAGFIDFLLPSICVGSAGAISPLPNIAPEFCMKLWRASRGFDNAVDRQFAKELQGLASLGEAAIIKKGLSGLKQFLSQQFGYPAAPRLPLPLLEGDVSAQLSENQHIKDIMELEKDLN
ncbi:dihydrodipicolinate synthase, putative [Metarhizium acridum CQMa 102]|uniref:Dihydrodipicolinate synthase, putative n=1 Tax=Metarhizium acridum (strain CQMa 102) TaxID=655827 RepID=E9DUD8_METAQ|nr:dihydrodipicolinate synthase, putative [Metarhizium acridum CQMa 102]EFY92600.1 dihydrodipicolinate synthase, putative [Metarhizium acridum CQMa 102]